MHVSRVFIFQLILGFVVLIVSCDGKKPQPIEVQQKQSKPPSNSQSGDDRTPKSTSADSSSDYRTDPYADSSQATQTNPADLSQGQSGYTDSQNFGSASDPYNTNNGGGYNGRTGTDFNSNPSSSNGTLGAGNINDDDPSLGTDQFGRNNSNPNGRNGGGFPGTNGGGFANGDRGGAGSAVELTPDEWSRVTGRPAAQYAAAVQYIDGQNGSQKWSGVADELKSGDGWQVGPINISVVSPAVTNVFPNVARDVSLFNGQGIR